MVVSYILLASFLSSALSDTTCPDAWVADRGSCYLFSIDQTSTFVEAQHYCGQHDAHLTIIDDDFENNFLKSFVRKFRHTNWWIGLTDELVEGDWRWYKTQEVPVFTDWAPNEPNSYGGKHNEDCGVMHTSTDFKWVDDLCSLHYSPICEKEAGSTTELTVIG
ncbi:asialoglycoprotein receptor 1-like [Mercenaria mercenaria]|uniref:asialoglycoprotein receptor 1-like n=1 Tax=Mercenaria mercenaria TaxID=6596 RepID=UPI00234EE225|nr:asialoglycoprotein receptor 1-like [Mercenaria mercenaria]